MRKNVNAFCNTRIFQNHFSADKWTIIKADDPVQLAENETILENIEKVNNGNVPRKIKYVPHLSQFSPSCHFWSAQEAFNCCILNTLYLADN